MDEEEKKVTPENTSASNVTHRVVDREGRNVAAGIILECGHQHGCRNRCDAALDVQICRIVAKAQCGRTPCSRGRSRQNARDA